MTSIELHLWSPQSESNTSTDNHLWRETGQQKIWCPETIKPFYVRVRVCVRSIFFLFYRKNKNTVNYSEIWEHSLLRGLHPRFWPHGVTIDHCMDATADTHAHTHTKSILCPGLKPPIIEQHCFAQIPATPPIYFWPLTILCLHFTRHCHLLTMWLTDMFSIRQTIFVRL